MRPSMDFNQRGFSVFWRLVSSLAISLTWLLPNHYAPWATFHSDAWLGVLILIMSGVFFFYRSSFSWDCTALVLLVFTLVPWFQYLTGQLFFSGIAFTATVYFSGASLAYVVGRHWESIAPSQLIDILALAIGIAAISSVGIQLIQWFELAVQSPFLFNGLPSRPPANLGQPNHLAILFLWALLSTAWGVRRGYLGGICALIISLHISIGLMLCQSRSASLALVVLIVGSWVWRRLWVSKYNVVPVVVLIICGMSIFSGFFVDNLSRFFLLSSDYAGYSERVSGELRPAIWGLFSKAVMDRPYFGFGFLQGVVAQFEVLNAPYLGQVMAGAHNLFLDILVWFGIPLGVSVFFVILYWLYRKFVAVDSAESALLFMFVVVLLVGSMFEFPYEYAYFVLPLALISGVASEKAGARILFATGRIPVVALWVFVATLLGVIVRDYFRVESSVWDLRMKAAHIISHGPVQPPDVIVLNQLRDFVVLSTLEPENGLGAADVIWIERTALTEPSFWNLYKVAFAYAMNNQPRRAVFWLGRMNTAFSAEMVELGRKKWQADSIKYLELHNSPWPR